MYAEAISMKARCIRQKTQTSCYHVKFVAVIALSLLQQKQDIRKGEDNMRKQNENFKTQAGSLYGEMAMEEANKHMTIAEFLEDMIPATTTCNICGKLITKKMGMMPCGPYHSGKTGNYVCMHCYGKYVQPLIDGLAEMKRTADREELMKEREYRC